MLVTQMFLPSSCLNPKRKLPRPRCRSCLSRFTACAADHILSPTASCLESLPACGSTFPPLNVTTQHVLKCCLQRNFAALVPESHGVLVQIFMLFLVHAYSTRVWKRQETDNSSVSAAAIEHGFQSPEGHSKLVMDGPWRLLWPCLLLWPCFQGVIGFGFIHNALSEMPSLNMSNCACNCLFQNLEDCYVHYKDLTSALLIVSVVLTLTLCEHTHKCLAQADMMLDAVDKHHGVLACT